MSTSMVPHPSHLLTFFSISTYAQPPNSFSTSSESSASSTVQLMLALTVLINNSMLIIQCLLHCALAFTTITVSQAIQYQLHLALDQSIQFDNSGISKHSLFSLHRDLVNIESISLSEQAVGEFLEAYLKSHNYTVERQYVNPLPTSSQSLQAGETGEQKQRFNLLAYPGQKRQTPVLLSSVSAFSEPSCPFLSPFYTVS